MAPIASRIQAVRSFNRFYTRQIGVLREGLLDSSFSLTELRVLYELAHRKRPTATELAADLGLDAGYLSRILQRFGKRKLIGREPSTSDGRQHHLSLTASGRRAFAPLEQKSNREVAAMLARAGDLRLVDLGDGIALADAGANRIERDLHRLLDDAGRLVHIRDLGR